MFYVSRRHSTENDIQLSMGIWTGTVLQCIAGAYFLAAVVFDIVKTTLDTASETTAVVLLSLGGSIAFVVLISWLLIRNRLCCQKALEDFNHTPASRLWTRFFEAHSQARYHIASREQDDVSLHGDM